MPNRARHVEVEQCVLDVQGRARAVPNGQKRDLGESLRILFTESPEEVYRVPRGSLQSPQS